MRLSKTSLMRYTGMLAYQMIHLMNLAVTGKRLMMTVLQC